MRSLTVIAVVGLVLVAGVSQAAWTVTTVGSGGGRMRDVAVGDGDGDGVAEVYAASADRHLYRFTASAAGWVRTSLGAATQEMQSVAVGDADNDGAPEVYGGSEDGRVYRFAWDGAQWTRTDIGVVGGVSAGVDGVAIGDGDNDGARELYAAVENGRTYRVAFEGGAWAVTDMGAADVLDAEAVAVGDGDNDGLNEVYTATDGGKLVRYGRGASGWFTSTVASGAGSLEGLAVGDADNDGRNEVYAASDASGLHRYAWSGAAWTGGALGVGPIEASGVAVGDGDGNGLLEAYVAADEAGAFRVGWTGAAWSALSIGTADSDLEAVAVGDGDGDGAPEVYAATRLGRVVEFATCVDLAPPVTTATTAGPAIDATWFAGPVTVRLASTDDCGGVTTLYRLDGGPLTTYSGPITVAASGLHEVVYHSKDAAGRVESANVLVFGVDVAPVTTATVDGPAGANGWLLGPATVTLSATDDVSGVAATRYRVDGGAWLDYAGAFAVGDEGEHTVEFFSVDGRGTTEATKGTFARIDLAAPSVALTRPQHDVLYVNDEAVASPILLPAPVVVGTLTLGADAADSGSGVGSVRFLVDDALACEATAAPFECAWDATTATPGTHVLRAVATDAAGREAETAELRVLVL